MFHTKELLSRFHVFLLELLCFNPVAFGASHPVQKLTTVELQRYIFSLYIKKDILDMFKIETCANTHSGNFFNRNLNIGATLSKIFFFVVNKPMNYEQ